MSRQSHRFHLHRIEDETGISGTGIVAYGVRFPDGTCVLRWDTQVNSTTFYTSINDVEYLHGHKGRTRIIWDDVPTQQEPMPPHNQCEHVEPSGSRCQWSQHPGNVHNILGLPGVPMAPTPIR